MTRRSRQQWLWPGILALATMLGLVSALCGDGWAWRTLSWLLVGFPLAIAGRHVWARPRPKARRPRRSSFRRRRSR